MKIRRPLKFVWLLLLVILPRRVMASKISDGLDAAAGAAGLKTGSIASWQDVVVIIINAVFGLLGTVALGLILYGGFTWMTAAGDTSKIDKAKKILANAVIGLVIVLLATAITNTVFETMGLTVGVWGG